MTEDLYAILGVEKTATKAEIKKAFRRKMKDAHPDREDGDHDLAVKLNRAWDILGDDVKRKRYDETGGIPGSSAPEPTLDDKAHACLAKAFSQMLGDEIDFSPWEDPLGKMIKAMNAAVKQYEFEIKMIDSYLKKLDDKQQRVKYAGAGTDLWGAVIEDKRRKYAGRRAQMDEAIKVTNRSLEIIKEYKGQFSEKKPDATAPFGCDRDFREGLNRQQQDILREWARGQESSWKFWK